MAIPSRSSFLRGSVFVGGVISAVLVGTSLGSAEDEWGCGRDRIGRSAYTPSDGGGYASRDEAVSRVATELSTDGPLDRAAYASAFESREGPTRFEPEAGKVYVEGELQATFAIAQLPDGTWTLDNLTACMRAPIGKAASPFPTPGG